MESYIIGIDVGTSGTKALLLCGGEVAGSASAEYQPDYPQDGYSEQDPNVWWEAVIAAVTGLLEKYPMAKGKVAALACSGQMHSSVFLDSQGYVVRKALLWNDTRTTKQVAYLNETVGAERFLEYTQNRALEGFTLPKILWLRDNEPENFARTVKVVLPKDYINYMLTGVLATEFSDAAGSAAFNVRERRFCRELLMEIGLDESLFPPVLQSTAVVGTLLPAVAAHLGLSPDTKVVAGGADNSCAAVGNGITKAGQAVISLGTSGTVVAMLDNLRGNITGDVHLFNYSHPGAYYAMGVMLSAGACLEWYRSVSGYDRFRVMDGEAGAAEPGSRGVVFLPYLAGERCPSNPHARGVFFGLSNLSGKAEMARAVMEGVAYSFRFMLELVEGFTGITELYITGGGAKSAVWRQIVADITGRELAVLNNTEGPSLGAAIIAGVGAGVYRSFDEAKGLLLSKELTVTPTKHDAYERGYSLFRKLYAALCPLFAEAR
ncbi:MAG: xylulokinase [Oscillospiraceae bacterium]|jgi:xylulokinase|nr:xylulokinase [Oscillospiraceae bacterium]